MTHQGSVSVPLACLSSGHKLTDDFKQFFIKIIGSVNNKGEFEDVPVNHPAKFPDIYHDGRKGRMHLRPEYTHVDVIITVGKSSNHSTIEKMDRNTKNIKIMEDEILLEDFKSKELRSLIESYVGMITQLSASSNKGNFDLVKLKQNTKIHKPMQFFEDFCQALYRKCEKVKKGFRVGQIFVTQVQVNLILNQGIIEKV